MVFVVKGKAELPTYAGGSLTLADKLLINELANTDVINSSTIRKINQEAFKVRQMLSTKNIDSLNTDLSIIAKRHGFVLLDYESFFMNNSQKSYTVVTGPDPVEKIYYDYGHLTREGAAYLGERLAPMLEKSVLSSASR